MSSAEFVFCAICFCFTFGLTQSLGCAIITTMFLLALITKGDNED